MSASSLHTSKNQEQLDCSYEILRKAGPFEVLTHVFHELGIQSNILVVAKYNHNTTTLTAAKVLTALADVISDHPALSTIGVSLPSEKQPGNHRLWEAKLPTINLESCVRFIDYKSGSEDQLDLARIFESSHNEFFDTGDKSKPWWRLVVLCNSYVVFVYHHSNVTRIGDGISGYAFHRSLLAALNKHELNLSPTQIAQHPPSVVVSSELPLIPCSVYEIQDPLSWVYVIYNFLFWNILRLFVGNKYFLFSDAVYSKRFPTMKAPFEPKESTNTKVQLLRIKKDIMSRCLEACRKNKTSFTALLHTLAQVTLATDGYPQARLGFSRLAVNIRPLLKSDPGRDSFTNAASNYGRVQFLGNYRAAGSMSSLTVEKDGSFPKLHVNRQLVWKLAYDYKTGLSNFVWKSRHVLQDYLTGKLLGEDEEEVGTFYGMGLYQNNSFLITNIGVFEPKEDMETGGWTIDDVQFSAGAIRSALGDVGIVFAVASVKDGDCVICGTYEAGVLKDEMVRQVLDSILARLVMVI